MNKITEKQMVRDIEVFADLVRQIRIPKKGWIKQIREILNMPTKALAKKCGLARSTVSRLEQSEQNRSITLKSLERMADGLNCDVRYMLVPREPMKQFVRKKAIELARKEVLKVSHTMSLEDQKTSEIKLNQQIEDLADDLLNRRSRIIWDDDE